MKPTALPKDIAVEEVTFKKDGNRINVQFCDGVYSICTSNWEFRNFDELISLFDQFKAEDKPKPKAEPQPKTEAKPKAKRTGQFAKRWTDEQKKHIAKRYKSGERTSSIAKDYGVSANTIYQLMLRSGVQRDEPAKNGRPPQTAPANDEQSDRERRQTLKEYREKNPKPWYLQNDKR